MGEQGHNDHHGLCRGAQPIEDRACGGAERLATLRTDEAPVLTRMDTDIALADLASGRAVPLGQNMVVGSMTLLLAVRETLPREVFGTPVCFTTSPHHGLVWSYPVFTLGVFIKFACRKFTGVCSWRPQLLQFAVDRAQAPFTGDVRPPPHHEGAPQDAGPPVAAGGVLQVGEPTMDGLLHRGPLYVRLLFKVSNACLCLFTSPPIAVSICRTTNASIEPAHMRLCWLSHKFVGNGLDIPCLKLRKIGTKPL